jgi:hypothetical protein
MWRRVKTHLLPGLAGLAVYAILGAESVAGEADAALPGCEESLARLKGCCSLEPLAGLSCQPVQGCAPPNGLSRRERACLKDLSCEQIRAYAICRGLEERWAASYAPAPSLCPTKPSP